MYTPFIYPINPRPIPVETDCVKGKLLVEGNLEFNYLRFRFYFDKQTETAPLAVTVEADGKRYIYNCILVYHENNEARSVTFHPKFFIGQKFDIVNIEPLVKLRAK